MRSKRLLSGLLSLLLVLGLMFVVVENRQSIYDWQRMRNYSPPTNIAALATATTMNATATKIFFVNRPELQNKANFNANCTDSEQSIVLGCYIQNKGIYLYDVKDSRLNGVEEVTAAHEMLHAAYDRLSSTERARVDGLTEKAYKNVSDERIKKTVEAYRSKDASVVPNELHSIIGTEVKDLPPELEVYYKRYFNDRKAIVAFSERYESEFTKLENQAEQYKLQLDTLKNQIDELTSTLKDTAISINTDFHRLESQRENLDPKEFNRQAIAYNQQVAEYNQSVQNASGMIDQYNDLVNKYNSVVLEESGLVKAIDSRPETIQAQ